MANTAKEEIRDFLNSQEAGIKSQYAKGTLQNAAESMFTANGLTCPVAFIERDGSTYILNREKTVNGSN